MRFAAVSASSIRSSSRKTKIRSGVRRRLSRRCAPLADASAYVEDDHALLRARLAGAYDLSPQNVTLGHGSNELLQVLFQAFVDPGDEVVMAKPTFSLFRKDTQVAGGRAVEVPLRDGVNDLDAMLRAVTERTKLVFVCDPNNPTGRASSATRCSLSRAPYPATCCS